MSESQLDQDIVRVRRRIARLRIRFAGHWREVERMPTQSVANAAGYLSQIGLGFHSTSNNAAKTNTLWGLLIAGASWYFSQPGAIKRLWRIVYPFCKSWRKPAKPQSSEQSKAE